MLKFRRTRLLAFIEKAIGGETCADADRHETSRPDEADDADPDEPTRREKPLQAASVAPRR